MGIGRKSANHKRVYGVGRGAPAHPTSGIQGAGQEGIGAFAGVDRRPRKNSSTSV